MKNIVAPCILCVILCTGCIDNTVSTGAGDNSNVSSSDAFSDAFVDPSFKCDLVDVSERGPVKIEKIGDIVTYNVTLINRGSTNLTAAVAGVTSDDENPIDLGSCTESIESDGILEPGETWVYNVHHEINKTEIYDDYRLSLSASVNGYENYTAYLDVPVTYRYGATFPCIETTDVVYHEVGADGHPIVLWSNMSATDPTYAQLMDFIHADKTDEILYESGVFVCADYAETVHNNAEAAGIRAGWVGIDFTDCDTGHACNVFKTTDMGTVYIDCTDGDKIVNIVVGEPYIAQSLFDNKVNYSALGTVEDVHIYQ